MTLRIAAAVAVFLALPLIAFRGRTLRRVLSIEVAAYVLAALIRQHVAGLDPYLAAAGFFAFLLAIFAIALAVARSEEVRWSATRAGVMSLLVYMLLIPAMMRSPIDGDEPYYLLMTESLIHDFDLDLSNQYASLAQSATGRTDLKPQEDDPTGAHGERYSRHEPFLPLLLVPGYLIGRLAGALATMAIFAALLARSTVRLLEDEGVPDRTVRSIFPLIAFGPPIVYFAARIWPEVPAALCFVEAIRGVRQRRAQRWIPAILLLALLKLRFVLVAVPLVIHAVSRSRKHALIGAAIVAFPLLVLWIVSGSATSVHSIQELMPVKPSWYARGFLGLILDGAAGIAFQAPLYLLGIFALTRWRSMPEAFRLGCIAVSLYLILLIPRWEWHGGWAPPLRYIAFFLPILALGAAAIWDRVAVEVKGIIALWTAGLVVHGVAFPWRLFHIANGENVVGEWFSRLYQSDFSRLFPSFIRFNTAAFVATIVLVFTVILSVAKDLGGGDPSPSPRLRMTWISLCSVVLAAFFVYGQKPAAGVEFEDAHVVHNGGDLFPHEYTVSRFLYRGGWIARKGDSLSFLAGQGRYLLHYSAGSPATIEIGGHPYELQASQRLYRTAPVHIPQTGRVELRVMSGEINLDGMVVRP